MFRLQTLQHGEMPMKRLSEAVLVLNAIMSIGTDLINLQEYGYEVMDKLN